MNRPAARTSERERLGLLGRMKPFAFSFHSQLVKVSYLYFSLGHFAYATVQDGKKFISLSTIPTRIFNKNSHSRDSSATGDWIGEYISAVSRLIYCRSRNPNDGHSKGRQEKRGTIASR